MTSFCDRTAFQVDATFAECRWYLVSLRGEGRMAWAQAEPGRLTARFNKGVYDQESGITSVEYALQESGAHVQIPGPPRGYKAWPPANMMRLRDASHEGAPYVSPHSTLVASIHPAKSR